MNSKQFFFLSVSIGAPSVAKMILLVFSASSSASRRLGGCIYILRIGKAGRGYLSFIHDHIRTASIVHAGRIMQTTEDDSANNRAPKWMWARQPIFMYLILVAAFVVCAVYVIHRVINLGAAGR